eukprot:366027-Chlamydomonas_euryale.AAC.8
MAHIHRHGFFSSSSSGTPKSASSPPWLADQRSGSILEEQLGSDDTHCPVAGRGALSSFRGSFAAGCGDLRMRVRDAHMCGGACSTRHGLTVRTDGMDSWYGLTVRTHGMDSWYGLTVWTHAMA